MMSGMGLKRPLGTPTALVQAVDKAGRAASFLYIKEALIRWAREVWLLGSKARPGDALGAKEVASAAQVIQDSLDSGKAMVNGPLWAVREAMRQLGWRIHSGGSAVEVVSTGEVIRLNLTSPRELARRAWEHWQDTQFRKVHQDMAPRRKLMGEVAEQEWCQQLIKDLVFTKTFDGRARALAIQLLAGTVPSMWGRRHVGPQTGGLRSKARVSG